MEHAVAGPARGAEPKHDWRAFSLQPHRTEAFKLSPDPLLIEKVRDIVGLYLNPPDKALVLCVDEKAQIQALDRSQPLLPMRPGQVERRTHDYVRHGTTSLFAALDAKTGRVIGRRVRRHRAVEFRKLLDAIDTAVPSDLDIHVIRDNYATPTTAVIQRWLAKRPRHYLHFTPKGASWINLVERWFGRLTDTQLRRGIHRSTRNLETAIDRSVQLTTSRGPSDGPRRPMSPRERRAVLSSDPRLRTLGSDARQTLMLRPSREGNRSTWHHRSSPCC